MVRPRRRLILGACVLAVLALGWGWYQCDGKYRRDFTGKSEEQVVSVLGSPSIDQRWIYLNQSEPYVLGWYTLGGLQLGMEFKNGIVQRQWYGSK